MRLSRSPYHEGGRDSVLPARVGLVSPERLLTDAMSSQPAQTASLARTTGPDRISRSELISALSFALDLTEGAREGHCLRSCLLGMRLAEAIGLSPEQRSGLFYGLLLKDVGCSSNAARLHQIFGGDERSVKTRFKLVDWTRSPLSREMLQYVWGSVRPGEPLLPRLRQLLFVARKAGNLTEENILLRCDRGATILTKLGMEPIAVETVRCLDEHWNGSGFGWGLRRDEIPIGARIAAVAQHLDVFAAERGIDRAMESLHERSGAWFDPDLVLAAESLYRSCTLWIGARPGASLKLTQALVVELDPRQSGDLAPQDVDTICDAFAEVVDAKSPFTFRHSVRVAEVSESLATTLGLPAERLQTIRRAALLHDIGKLAVPNSILDKPGRLTADEFTLLKSHPGHSARILERVSAFGEISRIAGEHHERLNGSGYPLGLPAEKLGLESRLVSTADVFSALAEDRPYRPPLPLDECLAIMAKIVPTELDPVCFEALQAVGERHASAPATPPAWELQPIAQEGQTVVSA